ncbi:sugar phosphate isomerase/epimerase [candidate division KSB1 bacterium]|nr:sugar phosphate isomerase/epimerase [candidate division KSB1 bacterium]
MTRISRRRFIQTTSAAGLALSAAGSVMGCSSETAPKPGSGMEFGLVTYQWGQDWDLPTLIKNCETAGYSSVELRTNHAHGVEPTLSADERLEVKKRFADSPVTCVGYGSNQEFHSPDPEKLKQQIDGTFELIKLCHDIGASGVKVKPNTLPEGVEPEKTIEQIGDSLNTVGKFAADYGQEIRVEVHGHKTSELPVMKAIFEHVIGPNVKICWNCNEQDLLEPGLEANFNMVKKWFGATVHARELNVGDYPYLQLFNLLVGMDYKGWILLEARTKPEDRVAAMQEQLGLFRDMVARAQAG